jgi:type II secretory pathway component GspD/PulD (secretin)
MVRVLVAASLVLAMFTALPGVVCGQAKKKKPDTKTTDVDRRVEDLQKALAVTQDELRSLRDQNLKLQAVAEDLAAVARRDKEKKAPPTARNQVNIYTLKKLDAAEVAKTLQQLLADDNRKIRIVPFKGTNSVLVLADPDDNVVIAAVIAKLEDQAPAPKEKARADFESSVVAVKNVVASELAPALRDLYRGVAEIAVDDRTNTIVVRSEADVAEQIRLAIRRLDVKADPKGK